jgi:hypothetical protein
MIRSLKTTLFASCRNELRLLKMRNWPRLSASNVTRSVGAASRRRTVQTVVCAVNFSRALAFNFAFHPPKIRKAVYHSSQKIQSQCVALDDNSSIVHERELHIGHMNSAAVEIDSGHMQLFLIIKALCRKKCAKWNETSSSCWWRDRARSLRKSYNSSKPSRSNQQGTFACQAACSRNGTDVPPTLLHVGGRVLGTHQLSSGRGLILSHSPAPRR